MLVPVMVAVIYDEIHLELFSDTNCDLMTAVYVWLEENDRRT